MHVRGGKSTLLLALKYKSWWRPGENGAGNPMKWWSHQMLAMKRGRWMGTAHILVTLWMPNILLIIYIWLIFTVRIRIRLVVHFRLYDTEHWELGQRQGLELLVSSPARVDLCRQDQSYFALDLCSKGLFCARPYQELLGSAFSCMIFWMFDVFFFWRFLLHKIFGLVVHFPGFLCWFGKRDGIPRT